MDKLIFFLTFAAALGSGMIAGLFFVFSNTIMTALGRLPASAGIAAMNSISVVILNPGFLGIFTGVAIVSGILFMLNLVRWQTPGSWYFIAGSLLYIIGSFLVTMLFSVPLNNALAASPTDTELWSKYVSHWTFWNHVRTVASTISSALFIFGLTQMPK